MTDRKLSTLDEAWRDLAAEVHGAVPTPILGQYRRNFYAGAMVTMNLLMRAESDAEMERALRALDEELGRFVKGVDDTELRFVRLAPEEAAG